MSRRPLHVTTPAAHPPVVSYAVRTAATMLCTPPQPDIAMNAPQKILRSEERRVVAVPSVPLPPPGLLDFLPRDLVTYVLSLQKGADCKEIARMCQISSEFNKVCQDDSFWEWQSKLHGYTHAYFLTPGPGQTWIKQGHTWREHYEHWCVNLNAADKHGQTKLLFESVSGSVDVVQALLAAGANVNAAHKSGMTSLVFATKLGRLEIVQTLLKAGADVNVRNNKTGETALMFAIEDIPVLGSLDMVQVLLDAGANVNAVENEGLTALMLASAQGDLALVQALLAAGASMNVMDKAGHTAMMKASANGRVGIVQALRYAGARY